MVEQTIKKVVVVGGGTAGWMSAALLKKVLGASVAVELMESDQIATVGVGEATIPPIQHVNKVLGLDEAEFFRETGATAKLAIRFENWRREGEFYYHTFGAAGQSSAFCQFHHYWLRARRLGLKHSLWHYDLNYLAAEAGKFAKLQTSDPRLEMPYAYHFDASLYGAYLRKVSEALGVRRTEGMVERVELDSDNGFVHRLHLADGASIAGDLFIDCSGFRALLIQKTLGVGYDDWSHWLPCDAAVSVPSQRHVNTAPFTRSIARSAGWQWRIPLQHRNGNGLVYASHLLSEDQACHLLLQNLDSDPLGDPRVNRFRTGRARQPWQRNVVAVGLSSGFLEPLESTSIHLIQSAVVRLLKYFPHAGIHPAVLERYNTLSRVEYEQVRDFLILHYHLNEREDSDFWRHTRAMAIPDTLAHKIALFRQQGVLARDDQDLFAESSWLQVLMGQGVMPADYHVQADSLDASALHTFMQQVAQVKHGPVAQMPTHDEFLRRYMGR